MANSSEKSGSVFSWKIWSIWAVGIAVTFFLVIGSNEEFGEIFDDPIFAILMSIFQGVFGATIYYGIYVWIRKLIYRNAVTKAKELQVEKDADQLQENLEGDFFNNLVKINFKYIDKYYLQTQLQADKSFIMSAIAAFVGLAIIIAGIALMFLDKTTAAYVTTATGAITEFISAIFFYLYNKTIMKMSEYHQKLVLTQNIGLAIKLSNDLPDEDRIKTQMELTKSLTENINSHLVSSVNGA